MGHFFGTPCMILGVWLLVGQIWFGTFEERSTNVHLCLWTQVSIIKKEKDFREVTEYKDDKGGRSHRKGNFPRAARQLALDRCCYCCLKNIFASFALFYQL